MVTAFNLTQLIVRNLSTYNLKLSSKLVLIYLSTCYNKKNKYVFPKQKKMVDSLGISRTSVITAIKELVDLGYINIKRKYSNFYEFNLSKFLPSDVKKEDIECSNSEQTYITNKEKIKERSFQNSNKDIESTQKLLMSYRDNQNSIEDYTTWDRERAINHLQNGIPRRMLNISTIAKYLVEKFSINLATLA